MRREENWIWSLIALTAGVALLLTASTGLSLRWQELGSVGLLLGSVGACAAYFQLRRNQRFAMISVALLQVVSYTLAYLVAMYGACALAPPLIDDRLAAWDAAFGVHLPTIVDWTRTHPNLGKALSFCYGTVLLQTVFVIVATGLASRRRELDEFVRTFVYSSLLVLVIFAVWPATGPFAAYGYQPLPSQLRYLEHFEAFRDGTRSVFSWRNIEGLVTFPSFHVTWALLLTYALRWNSWLCLPSVLLNLAVIAGTMTTGWHYFTGVVAGAAVAVVAVGMCKPWAVWRVWKAVANRPWYARRPRFAEIPWPGLIAAATTVLVLAAALHSSDWSRNTVDRLVVRPLTEMLRLAW
jgi:hypothetical protein